MGQIGACWDVHKLKHVALQVVVSRCEEDVKSISSVISDLSERLDNVEAEQPSLRSCIAEALQDIIVLYRVHESANAPPPSTLDVELHAALAEDGPSVQALWSDINVENVRYLIYDFFARFKA